MPRAFSLAYLTSAPLQPPQAIELAARLGYGAIGLRLAPAMPGGDFADLVHDLPLRRGTKSRLAATGLPVFDIEIVRFAPDFRLADHQALLDVAAELGARAILVAGNDPDEARLAASLAAFAEAAGTRNIIAALEFMPWTSVADAASAQRVVAAAGHPAARILVDCLHVARSGTKPGDLAALPAERLGYLQLCDAPAQAPADTEGLIHAARHARLLPGAGALDLAAMLAALPADLPASLEIPNDAEKARLGIEEWARRALAAAQRLVG